MPITRPNQDDIEKGGQTAPEEPIKRAEVDPDPRAREQAVSDFLDKPFPDQLGLSDEVKRGVVDMVKLDWETDSDATAPYLQGRIRDVIERYEQDVVKGQVSPFAGSSTISMADVPIATETVHPRLFGALWNRNMVNWRALNTPSVQNIPHVRNFMDWVLRIDMDDSFEKADELSYSTTLLGTTITHIGWKRMRQVFFDIMREENPQTKAEVRRLKKRIIMRERGFFNNLNLEDVPLPLSEGSDIHGMSHLCRRTFLKASEIINLSATEKLSTIDPSKLIAQTDELIEQDGELKQRIKSGGFSISSIRQRFRLEVINWFGLYDPEGSGFPVECEFFVIPRLNLYLGGTLLFTPEGRRPFEKHVLIPRKNFPYGIGIGELIRILAEERDIIHRQRIDSGSVSIIPFGAYRSASGFKPEETILQPATMIPLDDVNDLKLFNMSNPSTILAGEEAQAQIQIEKLTTAGAFQQGREEDISRTRATARGTLAIIGQGNIRFNLLAQRLQRSFARVLTQVFQWYQWLMPSGLSEKVLGNNGKQLFPNGMIRESIQGKFHAFLDGDAQSANKDFQINIATTALQIGLGLPIVNRSPRRIWEHAAEVYRSLGLTDIERYLGPIPPETNFAESAERMIEQIKQGFQPEPIPGEDHVQQLAAMIAFQQSEEFRALEDERKPLVAETIRLLRVEMVKALARAFQNVQGQAGQPQQDRFNQAQPQGSNGFPQEGIQ